MSVGGELMAAFETSLAPVALSPVVMQAMALGVEQDQITTFYYPYRLIIIRYIILVWIIRYI